MGQQKLKPFSEDSLFRKIPPWLWFGVAVLLIACVYYYVAPPIVGDFWNMSVQLIGYLLYALAAYFGLQAFVFSDFTLRLYENVRKHAKSVLSISEKVSVFKTEDELLEVHWWASPPESISIKKGIMNFHIYVGFEPSAPVDFTINTRQYPHGKLLAHSGDRLTISPYVVDQDFEIGELRISCQPITLFRDERHTIPFKIITDSFIFAKSRLQFDYRLNEDNLKELSSQSWLITCYPRSDLALAIWSAGGGKAVIWLAAII